MFAAVTPLAASGRIAAQQAPAAGALGGRSRPLVFRGVTVIDVESGQRHPTQTVVVDGNRIRHIGPEGRVAVPSGARVVNARGRYLIPGLWDMHLHPAIYGENHTDVFYPLVVAYGLTGVRDPGASMPLATFNRWKQEIAVGTRVGPRLVVAGPSINQCRDGDIGSAHQICVATPGEARLTVDFLRQAGADFVKPYRLSKEFYLTMLAEARRIGMLFGGHVEAPDLSPFEASDSGARFIDHGIDFQCGESRTSALATGRSAACADSIARLGRNGTWVVLTRGVSVWGSVFPDRLIADVRRYNSDSIVKNDFASMSRYVTATHDSLFRDFPVQPTSIGDFKAAAERSTLIRKEISWVAEARGVPIVAGTDASIVPGLGLHETLVVYVLSGMTPLEALQTATLNPAKALGATDSLGTVAAGKLADLVLLDADPLVDIWNTTKIRAVVANGRYFGRVALEGLRAQAERAAHRR